MFAAVCFQVNAVGKRLGSAEVGHLALKSLYPQPVMPHFVRDRDRPHERAGCRHSVHPRPEVSPSQEQHGEAVAFAIVCRDIYAPKSFAKPPVSTARRRSATRERLLG